MLPRWSKLCLHLDIDLDRYPIDFSRRGELKSSLRGRVLCPLYNPLSITNSVIDSESDIF